MQLFCFLVLILLMGCHRGYLDVRSEYLNEAYLASEQVNTPDPCRKCFAGQQLIVSWRLPCRDRAHILVTLRYGSREVEEITHILPRTQGYWIYRLVNDDYWMREGILSYKVELFQNGMLVDEARHHLWADLIILGGNSPLQ